MNKIDRLHKLDKAAISLPSACVQAKLSRQDSFDNFVLLPMALATALGDVVLLYEV